MKNLILLVGLTFFGLKTFAASPIELMTEAIAKSEGIDKSWFRDVSIKTISNGFESKYVRDVGDGGTERCEAFYRKNGTLAVLHCNHDYRAHSMGSGNRHFIINVRRFFDGAGKLAKAEGFIKTTFLINNKIDENRKIKSIDDEKIKELTKPLLKLGVQLIKQLQESP